MAAAAPKLQMTVGHVVLPFVLVAVMLVLGGEMLQIPTHVRLLAVLGSLVIWVGWLTALGKGTVFTPHGLLLTYVALSVVLSTVVASTVGFAQGFLSPSLITPRISAIQGLFLTGLFVGIAPAIRRRTKRSPEDAERVLAERHGLVQAAWVLLLVALVYRLYLLWTAGVGTWNEDRGAAQSTQSQLNVVASLAPLMAMALFIAARRNAPKSLIGAAPLVAFAVWGLASLALGTRDEVIGPVLLYAWAFHQRVRPISVVKVTVLGVGGFMVLAAVGVWRSGASLTGIADAVRPIASGTNTTALTSQYVPSLMPYLSGETYWASLPYMIPFLPVRADSAADLPAALRFPLDINYTVESGLGFSPMAEAYWNFGLVGTFIVPLLFGLFVSWAYFRSDAWVTTPISLLYPIIVARIPIAVRSDFLQSAKGVVLVMLVLAVAFALSRTRNVNEPETA